MKLVKCTMLSTCTPNYGQTIYNSHTYMHVSLAQLDDLSRAAIWMWFFIVQERVLHYMYLLKFGHKTAIAY